MRNIPDIQYILYNDSNAKEYTIGGYMIQDLETNFSIQGISFNKIWRKNEIQRAIFFETQKSSDHHFFKRGYHLYWAYPIFSCFRVIL